LLSFPFATERHSFEMWFGFGNSTPTNSGEEWKVIPECASPQTPEEYKKISADAIQNIKTLMDGSSNDGWVPLALDFDRSELITAVEKPDPNSGFFYIRVSTTIPCSPKKLADFVGNPDIKLRQQWDSDVLEMKTIEQIDENIQVLYRGYQAPNVMITARDFVVLSTTCVEPSGAYIICGVSINHKSCPADPKYVRGSTVTCFHIKPVEGNPNASQATRIVYLDPKGSIPAWVMSATKSKSGKALLALRDLISQQN